MVTEVVTSQNPLPDSITDTLLPPVTTFDSNFSKNSDSATQNIDLVAESDGIEKNKTFETVGGNSPILTPEIPTVQDLEPVTTSPVTTSPDNLSELVQQVKISQTWAEVTAVWGDDLDLKEKIKSQLSQEEYRRIGKLLKQSKSDSMSAKPIAFGDNPTSPEPAEPAENGEVQL